MGPVRAAQLLRELPLDQGWVSTDGPYNEHLVRDVGGLNVALGAVTIAVVLAGTTASRRVAGIGWLVYGLAHFVYHLHHLEPFTTIDAVLVALATAGTPALALIAVVATATSWLVMVTCPSRRAGRSAFQANQLHRGSECPMLTVSDRW